MAKEILLYTGLNNWSVADLITALDENSNTDVTIRVNSPGGDVFSSWGLFAKMKEHGNVTAKVDGLAASGAFNMLMYAKEVEALDVSMLMLHRADAYTETEEQKMILANVNKDLRKKLESKIDADKFKQVTGHTIDDLFNPETRVNIWLSAKQAKDLGIVSKIVKMNPEQQRAMAQAMASWNFQVAAEHKPENNTSMTLEKFKAENPSLYNQLVAEIKTNVEASVVKAERERVAAWMAYSEIDPKAVAEGITKGEAVTMAVMTAMQVKALSKNGLSNLKEDTNVDTTTPASETPTAPKAETDKEKEMSNFIEKAKALATGKIFQPEAKK